MAIKINDDANLSVDNPVSTQLDNISFACWVKVDDWDDDHVVFGNFFDGPSSGQGFYFRMHDSQRIRVTASFVVSRTGTIPISIDTWYHVIFTRTSGTWRGYVNNTLDIENTGVPYSINNDSETVIGAYNQQPGGFSNSFRGCLAELGFWNRVLTSDERAWLKNGNRISTMENQDDLVVYLPFNNSGAFGTNLGSGSNFSISGSPSEDDDPPLNDDEEGLTVKIKLAGTFVEKPLKTKTAGTFTEKPILVKSGGNF